MDAVTRSGSTFDYYFASRNPKERLKAITHENRPEGIAIYALCKEKSGADRYDPAVSLSVK